MVGKIIPELEAESTVCRACTDAHSFFSGRWQKRKGRNGSRNKQPCKAAESDELRGSLATAKNPWFLWIIKVFLIPAL